MIFLLLSILSSVSIFVLFKLFNKKNINTLQAIVINYLTASACGFLFFDSELIKVSLFENSWFHAAIGLGFLFIIMFYIMALTAQKNGLSVAAVASKMSVVIPVAFGIIIFKESLNFQKILGILLALVAVYMASIKGHKTINLRRTLYLPILVFLGSGVIDTSINYFAPDNNIPLFSAVIFAVAAIVGCFALLYNYLKSNTKLEIKAIPFGIALGIVNYASIFFLLKALRVNSFDTSTIFTVNNVAIVAISTISGLLLFKETITVKNWTGILIAMLSILLVTLS